MAINKSMTYGLVAKPPTPPPATAAAASHQDTPPLPRTQERYPMEELDLDGSPALPFAVPQPLADLYEVPVDLVSPRNLVLRNSYLALAIELNPVLAKIDEFGVSEEVYGRANKQKKEKVIELMAKVLRGEGNIKKFTERMENRGEAVFAMPASLQTALCFAKSFIKLPEAINNFT